MTEVMERGNDRRKWLSTWTASLAVVLLLPLGCFSSRAGDAAKTADDSGILRALMLSGHDLHPSIEMPDLESIREVPIGIGFPPNPKVSKEPEFVEGVARGSSQGRLNRDGMRTALYARYVVDGLDIGIYALEARTGADADRREKQMREIWQVNAGVDRAMVARGGRVLVVAWHDAVPQECWDSAKTVLRERLKRISQSLEVPIR